MFLHVWLPRRGHPGRWGKSAEPERSHVQEFEPAESAQNHIKGIAEPFVSDDALARLGLGRGTGLNVFGFLRSAASSGQGRTPLGVNMTEP
eukprot:3501052-Amphidinium_carterae.1